MRHMKKNILIAIHITNLGHIKDDPYNRSTLHIPKLPPNVPQTFPSSFQTGHIGLFAYLAALFLLFLRTFRAFEVTFCVHLVHFL